MLNESANITVWIAFSAGLLSFFSPCVLPLIPSFITYITGISFGDLKQDHPSSKIRWKVATHSLAFVIGFSTVFITLGAIAGSVRHLMEEWLIWVQRGGGIMVFLFGIHMTGLFHFGVLLGDKRVTIQNKPSGYFGSFLVGLAFAAGWTPCIGPILGAIFALAAGTSNNTGQAIFLLCCYSAGLGIPFMLSGLLFHGFLNFFNRFKKHIRLIEIVTGVLMIVVGILLFFNLFSDLSGYLYQWLPILIFAGLLMLVIAFLFSNNMTLMLTPEAWQVYFSNSHGTFLNLGEPTLWPRYLHMLIGASAVGGLAIAVLGRLWAKNDAEVGELAQRTGLRIFLVLTSVQLLVGIWFLLSLPADVMMLFMGRNLWATAVFALALVVVVAVLVLAVRKALGLCAGGAVLLLYLMTFMRAFVRLGYVDNLFVSQIVENQQDFSPLALFVVTLMIGLVLIFWMLKAAWNCQER